VPSSGGNVLASPAVRKRARDLGVDLAIVTSAQGDRIRHSDLDDLLLARGGTTTTAAGAAVTPVPLLTAEGDERIKVIGLRRRIASAMQESKRRIPHFSYVEEVDVTALEALRQSANAADDTHLTILPFLVAALCQAVAEFPQINATFDDEAGVITRHSAVHIGIATQTPTGLVVPVVRNAHQMRIRALAREISRVAKAARSVEIASHELTGSTLTVSSLGALGGIMSTPIINRPEVAIVGVNRIAERPVIRRGKSETRKMMNLSSSFDHRVVDGWDAASFIQTVRKWLELPICDALL
jgi:2-oxoisovalerate dehydrogenase E2 component (dihydrolipoyl transacylase)